MREGEFCTRQASRRLIAADPQLRRRGSPARQVRCNRLVEIHAEHRALARAGRHDRDRRTLGGRGSARPNERADLRGEHAGQH